ncbi:uncharacterized protein si:ch211-67e16.3 [Clupea harengus]|uniref:Uncharacterized protein si:ch211-67e16.3 n=1 Tax=Clupea harengus TaxID=7950 RepID=A0A6P8GRV0_CLUHA|nr:uncharacterized protein si:ch211-67e16.3 [Clupea harengus]
MARREKMRGATLCLVLGVLNALAHTEAAKFTVSKPYMHTLNLNGSVSVTCHHDIPDAQEVDAKLWNEHDIVCEDGKEGCAMKWEGLTKVTYTLWNLQASDEDKLFRCQFSRTEPIPIIQSHGNATNLFPGCKIPFPPPRMATPTSISSSPTSSPAPRDSHPPTDPLVWFLIGAAVLLCLYSFIVTILFHKLKVSRTEVLYDTLTYLPNQHQQARTQGQARAGRGPREVSEEYMDMREVQQKAWSTQDMNHNSQAIPNGFVA